MFQKRCIHRSAIESQEQLAFFLFVGKTRTTVKILHRESNGVTLYVRKLSEGRFQMPRLNDDSKTCTLEYREFVKMILGAKWEIEGRYEAKYSMPKSGNPETCSRPCV